MGITFSLKPLKGYSFLLNSAYLLGSIVNLPISHDFEAFSVQDLAEAALIFGMSHQY